MKSYLNINEQIVFLKKHNMKFNRIDESRAKDILTNSVYLHRLLNYKLFFKKYKYLSNGDDDFNGIDFADLYELAIIDKLLRELFDDICLDVEYYFKAYILKFIEENNHLNEYFYDTIDNIELKFKLNSRMNRRINDFNDIYSKKNMKKYPNLKPVWVINEYLSFGEVLELFEKHVKKNKVKNLDNFLKMLRVAKKLRNMVAHGNMLFTGYYASDIGDEILTKCLNEEFNIDVPQKYTRTYFMKNIVSTLYVYKKLAPNDEFEKRVNKLFLELHTFSKEYQLYNENVNEQFSIDMHYLYKVLNKMY